jgi:hypothetical protein
MPTQAAAAGSDLSLSKNARRRHREERSRRRSVSQPMLRIAARAQPEDFGPHRNYSSAPSRQENADGKRSLSPFCRRRISHVKFSPIGSKLAFRTRRALTSSLVANVLRPHEGRRHHSQRDHRRSSDWFRDNATLVCKVRADGGTEPAEPAVPAAERRGKRGQIAQA